MSRELSLMGLENELLVSVPAQLKGGQLVSFWSALMEELRCSAVGVSSVDGFLSPPGLMLANGGRVYVDLGYLESATAEDAIVKVLNQASELLEVCLDIAKDNFRTQPSA